MKIGVPKEVKDQEYRVGLTPAAVHALTVAGHQVMIQESAGLGSGIQDEEYVSAGAVLEGDPEHIFAAADMIVKVKEPAPEEYERLERGQILFTFLHLAPLPELTSVLLEREVSGVGYETIADAHGHLPLLIPMSEIAGRMAVLIGSFFMQSDHGGRGSLLSGVPGVPPGDVVIVGGGTVGFNAAKIALGLGARVTVLDLNLERLRYIDDLFRGEVTTLASNHHNLLAAMGRADCLIGAVLIPGSSAPKLITREMLGVMKHRAVIVDVAVDQGGCLETTRPTTHSDPVYDVDGVTHYCVPNMPGAVPRTSTYALTNATLPYILALANKGLPSAVEEDPGLALGVNTFRGRITCRAVAESQSRPYHDLARIVTH